MKLMDCPFCSIPVERIISDGKFGFVVRDAFPLSFGHSLVISKRHVSSFFDLKNEEKHEMITLLDHAKNALDSELSPEGYNVGINDGQAAGQTVPHLHIHLIPRYKGDVEDPRGGVRWIFPDKADYWSKN